MALKEIKKKMTVWQDFYGGEILALDTLKKARTKKACVILLRRHRYFLERQQLDALTDIDNFIKDLGLEYADI